MKRKAKGKYDDMKTEDALSAMADNLASGSIVTRALSKYIYQMLKCVYEDRIAPLEVENAKLKAELSALKQCVAASEYVI